VKIQPTELEPTELGLAEVPAELEALAAAVKSDGGSVLSCYREPLGGSPILFVALPIDRVKPTPFQRDLSDSHVRKLTHAMDKTKRFLDPIIVVRDKDQYFTPNGHHRLTALRELGARAILGLLVPEKEVAYQILALNIEKAHNLRERALEAVRMYRDLASFSAEDEAHYELELEEAALVTLGFAYETRGRLAGGAYHPALRKVDSFVPGPLAKAVGERERRAALLITLDDAVGEAVAKLKERGLTSPYLKSFVVARCNPLRFIKGDPPSFDELMETMTKRARGLNADKVRTEDLARSGGAPDEDA
jgi:ParB family chromosome partitioning protein